MMHRLIFVVTVAAALAACGDDETGGGGSGGGTGGSTTASTGGDGGGDTSTTTSTGTGEGGGGGATTTTGGGGGDFQSLIDACETLDEALNEAATAAALECTTDSDCANLPDQFPGCEAEVEALLVCQTEGFDPADCTCTEAGLDCGIFTICQAELDAFTTCRDAQ